MPMQLALPLALTGVGLSVPFVLIVLAVLWFGNKPPAPSLVDDRRWRQEMLALVAAARLSDELREARSELDRRRSAEATSTKDATVVVFGRPPVSIH